MLSPSAAAQDLAAAEERCGTRVTTRGDIVHYYYYYCYCYYYYYYYYYYYCYCYCYYYYYHYYYYSYYYYYYYYYYNCLVQPEIVHRNVSGARSWLASHCDRCVSRSRQKKCRIAVVDRSMRREL